MKAGPRGHKVAQAAGPRGSGDEGFPAAQHCLCQVQQPPGPPWRRLALLAPGHRSQRQGAKAALVLCLGAPELSRSAPSPPPLPPSGVSGGRQRGTVSARVLVFICASSAKARPHGWKGGRVCVCVCARARACVLCGARTAWEPEGG